MIEICDLEHRFADGTVGLAGISLTIADGEFVIITGPNGSGKTTLIRHLNGLLKPSKGYVHIDGLNAANDGRKLRQLVGMVFQDADSQIVGETVFDDVAFGPENLKLSPNEVLQRVTLALQAVGLEALANKSCHLLSGGEKRRLAIAGVLAMQPRVIIFDEPFANLDYGGVQQVLRQLTALHQAGRTIIVTAHDLEKVIAHADRLIILHSGELRANGAPQQMIEQLSKFGIRPPCYVLLGGPMLSWLQE